MSTLPASVAEPVFSAFAAIDWGSQEHVVAVVAAAGGRIEINQLKNAPESLDGWAGALRQRFGDGKVAVAIEQKQGAVVYMLSKYDHLILYPVAPTMSASYRHAFFPSGAKDDDRDTLLLLDLLRHHRDRLSPLQLDTAPTRLLRFLTEHRRQLVQQKVRVVQQLTDAVQQFFPQIRSWFGALDTNLAAALLQRWPSLEHLQRAHPGTLKRFFSQHRAWDDERIAEQIRLIYAAVPATRDEVVVEACSRKVASCLARLRIFGQQIALYEKRIATITADHPDAAIFHSLPGAGAALTPRLIAAFGTNRDQWRSAADMQRFSGIAPVLIRSGNSSRVAMRRACPKFVHQTFHELAGHSLRFCPWAKLLYEHHLKADPRNHHRAVRAVAYQWIRIAFRCWVNRQPYDERIFLAAQQRRNSPLVGRAANQAGIAFDNHGGFQKLTAK